MSGTSQAVFVSYASQDAEAASRICEALRAAGIEVWFDQSELRGGDAWDQSIRKQIKTCAMFLPVISRNTHDRVEGYFRLEWKLAVDRSHLIAADQAFLLPVVIDDTRHDDERVPERFREVQWTRLPGGVTPAAFVERVRRLLAGEPAQGPTGTPSAAPRLPAAPSIRKSVLAFWQSKAAILVTIAVVVVALGYLVANRLVLSKRGAEVGAAPAPAAQSAPATAFNPPPHSIAVLPFADLSEKHDQGYFADGLAEEILDLLAKIPGLNVIGRTSSFQFRDKAVDVRSIGSALGAAYVLEGSVRRSGDQVRVTAQLISTRDGNHRWSDTYDGRFDDLFTLQDSIASDLTRTLEVAMTSSTTDSRASTTPEAYDLYMQGKQALDTSSEEGVNRAIALFTESLRVDPKSSRTLSALAYAYALLGEEGWMLPDKAFEKARTLAKESLGVDKGDGQAHQVLGIVASIYDWNWERAHDELTTAQALSHRTSEVLVNAAQLESALGHWDDAIDLLQEALAKDPLFADAHMILGAWVYLRMGKFVEAEAEIRRALQIRPHWGSGRYLLATCLMMQGRLQEALKEAQSETPRDGKHQATSVVLYAMKRQAQSDAEALQAISESESEWPSSIAKVYAFRGQFDDALKWLDRAYKLRDEDLYWIKGDPLMRKMETDARYKAFLRKMNLPE